jgi:hypothetical protein
MTCKAFNAAYARLVESGALKRGRPEFGPNTFPQRRPNTVLVRVPMRHDDGRVRDMVEAQETLAGKPWANELRYVGAARGLHLFERPKRPEDH